MVHRDTLVRNRHAPRQPIDHIAVLAHGLGIILRLELVRVQRALVQLRLHNRFDVLVLVTDIRLVVRVGVLDARHECLPR